jgi:lipid-binding SYLF domain-containing protein
MKSKIAFLLTTVLFWHGTSISEITRHDGTAPEIRARMDNIEASNEFRTIVDSSVNVYKALSKGKHGEVPQSVLKRAQCIAILPNVVTGALVFGATHGSGLATCRNSTDAWSQPAAISLNEGSIGLQAGAKSTDLVLFFQTKEAVDALKKGNFVLGSDVSAVAGGFGARVDNSAAGVVVYAQTGGLFAGVSVNGSKISKEEKNLRTYYGADTNYSALLEGKESPDAAGYSQKLTKLLPRM